MSALAPTNVGIPAGSLVVKPPAHPTYDLKGVIQLALSEDAGDRGKVHRWKILSHLNEVNMFLIVLVSTVARVVFGK